MDNLTGFREPVANACIAGDRTDIRGNSVSQFERHPAPSKETR